MHEVMENVPVPRVVALRLQDMIRNGEFVAGKRLPSERKLADLLQVSRQSVREALMNLETLGLVKTYPARGTFVQEPGSVGPAGRAGWRFSPTAPLEHVFELRAMIEPRMAHSAAVTSTGMDIARLTELTDRMDESWQMRDLVTHAEADLAFHRHIAESCANSILVQIYENFRHILTETHRVQIPLTLQKPMAEAIITKSLCQHRAIVAALKERDPEAAEHEMANHISYAKSCAGPMT